MSESTPGLNLMAQEQRKINPIDDAISIFLKQQKEYDEYLNKLREETDKGTPTRDKKKKGAQPDTDEDTADDTEDGWLGDDIELPEKSPPKKKKTKAKRKN